MGKAELTFQIDEDLKVAFSAAAEAEGRSVADVLSDVMRDYVELKSEPSDYDTWFRQQVQEALDDPRDGIPHDEVMAMMDAEIARHAAGLKRGA
ncbi:CopG family ribbon-helix-helix protein [Asticcacaulis sp. YBE204]|uniref:type II toxin-antitoxin system RelB family antitoxin n=1 Tax=Asticcacaulis sp. YBE204 TaxID=1282363 RepID=UPI0003C3BDD9|nr:hypothetical protein [Asticcacaulis sp. YBE204]ESQ79583.1 hypothetical protein AEYBE204_07005 [Asticcacaulis sp. YBE204]